MSELVTLLQNNADSIQNMETHSLVKIKHSKKGTTLHIRGNGTEEDAVNRIVSTSGFNLPEGADAEVHVLPGSNDQNSKFAIVAIPHDKERDWKPGVGGIQSPIDPDRAVEVNAKRSYVDDKNGFATKNGGFDVDGSGNVIIRGNLTIQGDFTVAGDLNVGGVIRSGSIPETPLPSGPHPVVVNIPAFEE